MAATTQRRRDIDVGRGLAICLILIHHMAQYFMRYAGESFSKATWDPVVRVVSFMNVPAFMLMAGIVLGLSGRQIRTAGEYAGFARAKLCRLALPFLTVSLISLAIKSAVPGRSVSRGLPALVNTFIAPRGGGAGHLWFLYCLLSIFLLWPVLKRLVPGGRTLVLWGALLVVAVLPIPWPMRATAQPLLGLKDLAWYLPLFTIGYWYGSGRIGRRQFGPLCVLAAATVCAAGLLAEFFALWPAGFAWSTLANAVRWVGYLAGCLAVLWAAGLIDRNTDRLAGVAATVGLYSYDIYLLHVAFVGHPLAYLALRMNAGPAAAHAMFAIALLTGILVPIAMAKAIRRSPRLSFVLLGVRTRRAGTAEAVESD